MADQRRSLTQGLKATPAALDPTKEKQFVYGTPQLPQREPAAPTPSLSPISTRLRADFVAAIKRASLERQLDGRKPCTMREILEEAIEPWLRSNGYMP